MKKLRIVGSIGFALVLALAATSALAVDDTPAPDAAATGQPVGSDTETASPPARTPAKPKTDSEKAAARARADAEFKRRREAANEREQKMLLEQVANLGLNDEQKRRVEELPALQADWQKANESKISALRDRMVTARGDGDMKAVQSITEQLQALMRTRPDLRGILTPEQQTKMNEEAVARAKAARARMPEMPAGKAPAARPAPGNSPEVVAIHEKIKAARRAGDTETVERLQTELKMLKDAVRKARAAEAAARKDLAP